MFRGTRFQIEMFIGSVRIEMSISIVKRNIKS